MTIRLLAIATATLAFGAGSAAQAQDARDDQPFSGVYVGASGGYDVQHNDIRSRLQFDRNGDGNVNDTVTTATGADAFSPGFCNGNARTQLAANGCLNDGDDVSYYGRVGFDKQAGHIVIGALGEFGRSEIRDYVSGFSTTPASYRLERDLRWEASVRLRAGLAFGQGADAGMFYATGGAGYADIRHQFVTTNTANAFTPNNDGKKKFGYVVGGGVEKFLTKNISFGAEYSFHEYKDRDYSVRVTQGTAAATNPFVLAPNTSGTTISRSDFNFRWHSLRGTLNFHL